MVCDYILIIIYFLYLIISIYIIIYYCKNVGNDVVKEKFIILTNFRDIKIDDYLLPSDFIQYNDYQKRKYLLDNSDLFEIKISSFLENLISSINKIRKDNDIEELIYDKKIHFKDLIFDKYSGLIFYDKQNIFKLSNGNYLLKYPTEEFQTRLNNKEKNLINIILNDYLNKICIIEKNNILFISIFNSRINPFPNNYSDIFVKIESQTERKRFLKEWKDSGYYFEDDKYYEG